MNPTSLTRFISRYSLRQWMLIVGSTLVYVIGFVWLAPTAGGALIAFSLLPVIISAWVLGLRGGLAIGLLANVLNTVLLYLTRIPDVEGVLQRGIPGSIALVGIGAVIGWLGELIAWTREQSVALAGERAALRQEIAERKRAEFDLGQRNIVLETLNELSKDVSGMLEVEPILAKVAGMAAEAIDATSSYIGDWDEETGKSTILAEYMSPNASQLERVSDLGITYDLGIEFAGTLNGLYAEKGYYIEHVDDPSVDPVERAHLEEYGASSILGVPLLVEGKPIGYIEMWESRYKREFSKEEIELSQAIARQVARAIHNAQLHEALRQSEKRFRTLVERMGEGLVQMDNERVIQFVNDRFCEMLEYSRDEMLGKSGMDMLLEKNGSHIARDSNGSDRRRDLGQDELQLRKKSGEALWVQVSRAPVTNVEGEIVGSVEIHTDITKRKHAETELAKARDKALEANRLKSEMLAKVSHDLRTPLTAIVGFAEMIESGMYGDLSDKQRDVLLQIIESSEDLSDLVSELLDQAQLEAGTLKLKTTPFSIEDVVRRVHSVMNVLAESNGLDLGYEISSDVPQTLSGDPQRLQQILTNLVGNAIKFTSQGSIQICAFRPDESHWALQVSDSGAGIPPEAQSYIFQAFRQVDSSPTREYAGAGLGLSIVHQLTTLMGGEVKIDSEVGKGSRFTVVLPLELKQEKTS